jgi:maleylacetate reductase
MQSGTYVFPKMDRVIYGRPFVETVAAEMERMGAQRLFVLASRTLADGTDHLERLRAALGDRFCGLWTRIAAHTPRGDVVAAAAAVREARADLILGLGGGSVTDGGKMVRLCLANGVATPAELDRLRSRVSPDGRREPPPQVAPPDRPFIAVPTTLSAGEYTAFAGCTDTERRVKEGYGQPRMAPDVVILDPAVTLATPAWLWLSTGIRAVDHAVEDLCSIRPGPLSDAASLQALRLLSSGLPRSKASPEDLAARLDCLIGAWLSMVGSQAGVPKGASHGIGHVLGGTAGVPHGYTSCLMLPPVLRFNKSVNADRQSLVSEALNRAGEDASAAVGELIAGLGLPRRLRDVGVSADQLDEIARHAMHDPWIHTNPRRIDGPATIRALLDEAW